MTNTINNYSGYPDEEAYSNTENVNQENNNVTCIWSNITDIEENLKVVWMRILDLDEVGIDDNFIDLCGQSIKAIELELEIERLFGIRIHLYDIFTDITIRALAQKIVDNKATTAQATIERCTYMEYYPVSWMQKGIYTAMMQNKENTGFNMPFSIILEGNIDIQRFENAFRKLTERHEILRTSFKLIDGELFQKIEDNCEFPIQYFEFHEKMNTEVFINDFIRSFDIMELPLFRVALIKISPQKYMLLIDMHHLISDGTSVNVMLNELTHIYDNQDLPALPLQYKDYAVWQKKLEGTTYANERELYWRNMFDGELPILNIPSDFPVTNKTYEKASLIEFSVNKVMVDKLNHFARIENITLHTLIFSIYVLLLSKYSSQEKLVTGSVSSGRNHIGLDNLMGPFFHTLPISVQIDMDQSFIDFTKYINRLLLESFENQDYDFSNIIKDLPDSRKYLPNPFYDTMLNYHGEENDEPEINSFIWSYQDINSKVHINLDIEIDAFLEKTGQLLFAVAYNATMFKESTIIRIGQQFNHILSQILNMYDIKLRAVQLVMPDEAKLIKKFNHLETESFKDKTICELFKEQVLKTPDKTVAVYKNTRITYKELEDKANQLAALLIQNDINKNGIIGLIVDRSIDMLVGIMGILISGNAYLPIDPSYPLIRKNIMLDDCKVRFVVTQSHLNDCVPSDKELIFLDDLDVCSFDNSVHKSLANTKDLAYIIFTSGSSGKPKGVKITHRNIVSYINAFYSEFQIDERDVLLQQASYTFDVFMEEVFPVILRGGHIVIIDKNDIQDPKQLRNIMEENGITIISCSPFLLNELNKLPSVKTVHTYISGGDVLKTEYISNLVKNGNVYNTYGPTETTVCATYFKCGENISGNIPIGKPISNTSVYILDKYMNPVPIGIPGEIYITGDGVTSGYMGNERLTEERFILDLYKPDTTMYRTGDMAKWLNDGSIEFLGRVDNQIKLRGYRIEPGEIERKLLQLENIKEACVIDKYDSEQNMFLCAYIVCEGELIVSSVKIFLEKQLPEYMIPSFFIKIDKIPLVSNGKIDKKALPSPLDKSNTIEGLLTRNDVEIRIKSMWKDLLKIDDVSINDNFFRIGGNSLKAIITAARIQNELNIDISVSKIFQLPTVSDITTYILNANKKKSLYIEPVAHNKFYAASSAQKSLFAINKFSTPNIGYNIPVAIKIAGKLDQKTVENILIDLIKRHEALRTSFAIENNEIVQIVHEDVDFKVKCLECEESELNETSRDLITPFDLSQAPLIRVFLLKISENAQVLLIDMHHIISDAETYNIILREFAELYKRNTLPELRIQYKDFAAWQNNQFDNGIMKKQEEYWLSRFSNCVPELKIPLDYPRPSVYCFEGNYIFFNVSDQLCDKLNRFASETNTTMNIILFAAYNVLLAQLSCEEDLVVGMPVIGRTHPELENIVGMFVNTLAIRSYPNGNIEFRKYLDDLKETLLNAYDNQDYPFEMLLEKLNIVRKAGRNPLFDTVFSYRDNKLYDNKFLNDLDISFYDIDNRTSKFDLVLYAYEETEKIVFKFEFSTKLLKTETIKKFAERYKTILNNIIENKFAKINEIGMENLQNASIEIDDFEFNF